MQKPGVAAQRVSMAVCWLRLAATKSSASDACAILGSISVSHNRNHQRMAFMTSLPGGGLAAGGFHRLVSFFVIPGDKRAPMAEGKIDCSVCQTTLNWLLPSISPPYQLMQVVVAASTWSRSRMAR